MNKLALHSLLMTAGFVLALHGDSLALEQDSGKVPAAPIPGVQNDQAEQSKECQSFNLADKGGSMENVPVLDQGNLGTCYAYTAAGALDAWRFSAKPPGDTSIRTSPHSIAIAAKFHISDRDKARAKYHEKINPGDSVIEGHKTAEAVRAVKSQGHICSYDAFGSNFNNTMYARNPKNFWLQIQDSYEFFHTKLKEAVIAGKNSDKDRIVEEATKKFSGLLCEAGFKPEQVDFKLASDMARILLSDNVFEMLIDLSSKICRGHQTALPPGFPDRPVTFNIQQITPESQRTLQNRSHVMGKIIDAMFDFKNRQPLMIAYCSEVLTNPENEGRTDSDGKRNDCTSHASLIIGRGSMPDGRCGFLVRNSWGTDRDDAHGVPGNIDDRGDIWVSEHDMYRNLYEISVIPPQGETYKPPKNAYLPVPAPRAPAPLQGGGFYQYPKTGSGNP